MQPIPCIPGAKDALSERERAACDHDQYARLPDMLRDFKRKPAYKKLGVIDFSRYFRAEQREVFLDDLHLNQLGLDLITGGILEQVASSPRLRPKPVRKIKALL